MSNARSALALRHCLLCCGKDKMWKKTGLMAEAQISLGLIVNCSNPPQGLLPLCSDPPNGYVRQISRGLQTLSIGLGSIW